METIIETEKSALNIYYIDDDIMDLLHQCVVEIDAELDYHPKIIIRDKICFQHRSLGFYSDFSIGYQYSGQIAKSKSMKPCLIELINFINDKFDADFNGILINKYENGEEYIGRHSDDEKGLHKKCGVVALSYGAPRKFRIRDKITGNIITDTETSNNKIIQMAGDFQKEFTHEIPIEKKIKDCRYSFTFRKHNI